MGVVLLSPPISTAEPRTLLRPPHAPCSRRSPSTSLIIRSRGVNNLRQNNCLLTKPVWLDVHHYYYRVTTGFWPVPLTIKQEARISSFVEGMVSSSESQAGLYLPRLPRYLESINRYKEENSVDISRCAFCAQYEQTQNTHELLTAAIRRLYCQSEVRTVKSSLPLNFWDSGFTWSWFKREWPGLRSRDNADFAQAVVGRRGCRRFDALLDPRIEILWKPQYCTIRPWCYAVMLTGLFEVT